MGRIARGGTLLAHKRPVLTDERRQYLGSDRRPGGVSVISQGGVVYNAPLKRYIYSSWSEHTWEFYEAPAPWGPWRPFLHTDFGPYPWPDPLADPAKHGGYATSIPSKFISADGRDMWVQSNWFVCASTAGGRSYNFSLRRLHVEPLAVDWAQEKARPGVNLAHPSSGATSIGTVFRGGLVWVLNDGDVTRADDSWNGRGPKRVGYTWPAPRAMNQMVYTVGPLDWIGGWFDEGPWVEVRLQSGWEYATGVTVDPPYPNDSTALGRRRYTIDFDPVVADGVRIVGRPGGGEHYTSIAELEVYRSATSYPRCARR
jgi:hypothetical protein